MPNGIIISLALQGIYKENREDMPTPTWYNVTVALHRDSVDYTHG